MVVSVVIFELWEIMLMAHTLDCHVKRLQQQQRRFHHATKLDVLGNFRAIVTRHNGNYSLTIAAALIVLSATPRPIRISIPVMESRTGRRRVTLNTKHIANRQQQLQLQQQLQRRQQLHRQLQPRFAQ